MYLNIYMKKNKWNDMKWNDMKWNDAEMTTTMMLCLTFYVPLSCFSRGKHPNHFQNLLSLFLSFFLNPDHQSISISLTNEQTYEQRNECTWIYIWRRINEMTWNEMKWCRNDSKWQRHYYYWWNHIQCALSHIFCPSLLFLAR